MISGALGIIEGYYGAPWGWGERWNTIAFLARHSYSFYIYAPKADEYLRRHWREPHTKEVFDQLGILAASCRHAGVSFGVGLSPYEIYRGFDAAAQMSLGAKLAELDELGLDTLAILFDDMKGDLPNLAVTQAHIVHWIAERTKAAHILMCPSYYSDDPILDRIFGARPKNYLKDIGRLLDPKIDIFWTGPKVCSPEYALDHLDRVAGQLGRKPFLWDNYPVNDGPRMSPHLHLRAVTGRPAAVAGHIAGHAVNPALQPVLTRIPMLTLADSYAKAESYDPDRAFLSAATAVCGEALAQALCEDIPALQDSGLNNMAPDQVDTLRSRYTGFDHPAAREVEGFLDGKYRFTGEMM